jgi:hypothetical protein
VSPDYQKDPAKEPAMVLPARKRRPGMGHVRDQKSDWMSLRTECRIQPCRGHSRDWEEREKQN